MKAFYEEYRREQVNQKLLRQGRQGALFIIHVSFKVYGASRRFLMNKNLQAFGALKPHPQAVNPKTYNVG